MVCQKKDSEPQIRLFSVELEEDSLHFIPRKCRLCRDAIPHLGSVSRGLALVLMNFWGRLFILRIQFSNLL